MRFKFVHAADLHLDSPMRGLSADGPWRKTLQASTLKALERIVDLCIAEHADFLLLAGDLFDAKDRSVRARLALKDAVVRLDKAGIRTFIVHGNHDPLVEGAGGLVLPQSTKVFGTRWEDVAFERDGRVVCRIQGVSYGEARVTEDLSRLFRRTGPEFAIGLLHANVGGVVGHEPYSPCALEDLAARGLDYWALGHVHTRAEHALTTGGVAVYPGNSQGRHANETGPRGCMLVEVDGGKSTRRFVPVDDVRWSRLDVDIAGMESIDEVVDAVQDRLDSLDAPNLSAHAVRVVLHGRGRVHKELQADEAREDLLLHLTDFLERRSTPVFVESVVDDTEPGLDLAEIERRGGLSAEVLTAAREQAPWGPESFKPLDAALKRAGLPLASTLAPELLERASQRALELLAEEDG